MLLSIAIDAAMLVLGSALGGVEVGELLEPSLAGEAPRNRDAIRKTAILA